MDSAESRIAPVVPLRGPERLLGTRSASGELDDAARFDFFMTSVRERIEQLTRTDITPKQLARDVLAILRQIIREDSDHTTHEDALESLFHRLYCEPSMRGLFIDLHNRGCAVLHSATSPGIEFDKDQVAHDLEEIVSWYQRRKSSLALLSAQDASSRDDSLFGLKIFHDRTFLGVEGFEVSCGLRLLGHRGRDLWFKVFLRAHGEFVHIKPEWKHWTDDTETFVRSGVSPVQSREVGRVAGILPLEPSGQRVILDSVRCFIPYAALGLDAGRHDVLVEAGVYDALGKRFVFSSQPERISMPSDGEVKPIPSPQSMGLWSFNPGTGDAFSHTRVGHGYREDNREVLTVTTNLDLLGHRGEILQTECRFMRMNGDPVESASRAYMEPDGTFVYRSELVATKDITRYFDRTVEIPMTAFSLDEGDHELLCTLSIIGAGKKIICGALARCTVHIGPESIVPVAPVDELIEAMENPEPASDLQVGGFFVDPSAHFNSAPTIKLGLDVGASDWKAKLCRVVLSIEQDPLTTPSTKLRLRPQRQTLSCGGFEMPARQSLVAQFNARDIASYLLFPAEGAKLLARAQVYTLDDRLIFNRTRPFVLSPQSVEDASQIAAFASSGQVRVVDMATRPVVGSPRVKTEVVLDVRLDDPEACRFSLYHEVMDPDGRALKQHGSEEAEMLPGSVVSFDFSEENFHCRHRDGWTQLRVELPNHLSPDSADLAPRPGIYTLKLMLFTDQGKLTHIAHQPLLVRGKNFGESPLAISYDFDRTVVLDVSEPEMAPPVLDMLVDRVRNWFRSLARS